MKRYKIQITDRARQLVAPMSFRQLLNQVICEHALPGQFDSIGDYGSFFFHPTEEQELRQKIEQLKQVCAIPPLVVSDLENGPGRMIKGGTEFPEMVGAGVADSEDLAYRMGKIAALEGRALGYNWTLSPCVDLINIPDSPMVSVRSPGKDPAQVIKIAGAYLSGLQENGMMATLKHFPGDGFDIYDQHLTVAENPLPMDEWRKTSGRVFEELIDAGAMAIMPGHISMPCYDEKNETLGIYPPATLSKKILTGLLKDELGFEGLIVSDAVNMGGMIGYLNYFQACALFLEAGGDILLFPRMTKVFYAEMEKTLERGELTMETLRNRAERIISLKEQMGLLDATQPERPVIDKALHEATAKEVVDACVSIVRDRQGVIPFKIGKDTRILHPIITNNYSDEIALYKKLTEALKAVAGTVVEIVTPTHGSLFDRIYNKEFDLVIVSIGNRYAYGTNIVRLHGPEARGMMEGWMRIGTPVIFVAHYHPLMHIEYQSTMDTVINTYGSIDYTFARLIKGITGEQPIPHRNF